jgi:hypothetical protein
MKFKLSLLMLLVIVVFRVSSQVTFTHTLNADFNKGTTENIFVKNDGLSIPFKKSVINDWTSTTNLPQNLTGHQVASWRSFVFLSGGFNGTKYNNFVYKATVNTSGISSWTQVSSLPDSIGYHAMISTGTKLYVIGGKKGALPSSKIYAATINDDGSLGTWSQIAVMLPQPLWGHTAQLINGFLYIAGGTNVEGTFTSLNTVYYSRIDAEDNLAAFTATTALPEARNGHTMTKYNGKLYVLGGFDNAGVRKTTVYYSTVNANGTCGSWLSATPLPVAVSNHISTCSNGIITVIGGEENTILSNKFYLADIDNTPSLTWELSDRYLFDRAKNSSAFAADNQIVYTGGVISTGVPVNNMRYVSIVPSANRVKKGIFISTPFVVGAPKNIQKLTYTLPIQSGDTYELLYRLAGVDKIWGDWVSAGTSNPVNINQTKSYIQYMFRLNANSTNDIVLSDITLTVSGYTQLCGNLDAMTTLSSSGSPYWATCDISFTTGSHIIQPGVTVVFSPNTGLTIGQASVSFNGSAAQPIRLASYDSTDGTWNGVYFTDASDAGVSSQINYTTIERAGNGTNNANLWCSNTNQPVVNNCTFRKAVGLGVRMENSNFILNNTFINDNAESGLYLYQSNPILNNVTTQNNGYAGIYYASVNLNPSYSYTKSQNNLYGLYSPTPDVSFSPESATTLLMLNNTTDIAVAGGVIYSNRSWKYFPKGYVLLGDVTVNQGGGNPTLTIGPGTRIRVMPNFGLYIGGASTTGGQLYAVGKADSLITFTASNGIVGGWKGLYFNDGSDYNSTSSLRYCTVELGNEYNIFSVNSNEPHIMFSTIRNSITYGVKLQNSSINIEETIIKKAQHGIYLDNSSPSLILVTIDSIQSNCVYHANAATTPNYSQCMMKNSLYGIYYPNPNFSVPAYTSITFSNLTASIVLNGGDISSDQIWNYNPFGYAILDNVRVLKGNNGPKARLTINAGCVLKFAVDKQLQIGFVSSYWYVGELNAVATAANPITFTALNGLNGGWNGIYFNNASDEYTGTSFMRNCIVEKGNQFNIWCNSTSQPTIDSCTIRYAGTYGLNLESAPLTITNSIVSNNGGIGINSVNSLLSISKSNLFNNGGYGLYYNNAYYVNNLQNLEISGNSEDGVFSAGGDVSDDRIWYCFGNKPYVFLDNVRVIKGNNGPKARLTVKPGCVVKFAAGKQLQIGYVSSYWYVGELWAAGTSDSLITFTSYNNAAGGWNGIYFHDASDMYSAISLMKYCTVSKGNQYNIWCNNTVQPTLERVTLSQSAGYGLWLDASNVTVKNSIIKENLGYGVYLTNGSIPVIGNNFINACDIYSNSYNIYNNTSNNIDMRYNFLGSCDSSYIEKKTWDKSDNTSLGKITFMPFSWLPAAQLGSINVSGKFLYDNNASKPLRNALLTLKDYTNNTLATATTNTTGSFTFAPLQLSIPTKINFTLQDQFGGINSTDALKVMQHFTFFSLLDANHTFIADVNKSKTVNGTDALMILQRFTGIISSFPTGNLQIDCDSVTPTPPAFYYNLAGTWFGDVNGSYSTLSKTPGLSLVYNGIVNPGSWQEFSMRVKVLNKLEPGAISLVFNYPAEYLEVLGVQLIATGENLGFTAQNGLLKTGWYNLNPITTLEEDILVTIRFMSKDLGSLEAPVSITLGEGGEIADQYADTYGGVILSVPVIPATLTAVSPIDRQAGEPSFSFYPNPVKDRVTFIVNLTVSGIVSLSIADPTGRIVTRGIEEEFGSGEHRKLLDLSSLERGIYLCRFRCAAGGKVTEMTRKLVLD